MIRYGVASSFDLWAVFENYYFDTGFQLQEGVEFTDFVTSWTDQVGFPLINVIYENSRSRFKITQVKLTMIFLEISKTIIAINMVF